MPWFRFASGQGLGGVPNRMEEMFTRAWDNLLARDSGPLHFRLFLQPLVATILAIRAGWADAWAGRPIFFWTLVREPAKARPMLRNLWKNVGKVFLVAVALDVGYRRAIWAHIGEQSGPTWFMGSLAEGSR